MKTVIFDVPNAFGTRVKEVRMTINDDAFKFMNDFTKEFITITLAVRYTRPHDTNTSNRYVDVMTFNQIDEVVANLRELNLDERVQEKIVKQVKENDRIEEKLEWLLLDNGVELSAGEYTEHFANMLFAK